MLRSRIVPSFNLGRLQTTTFFRGLRISSTPSFILSKPQGRRWRKQIGTGRIITLQLEFSPYVDSQPARKRKNVVPSYTLITQSLYFDQITGFQQMSAREGTGVFYTREQIDSYLSYISFPVTKYKTITAESAHTEAGLAYLSTLQKYQHSHVLFENLLLHYSKKHLISLDKDDLFEKIVASMNGRGGYCMENNTFFGTVLKTLGFGVIPTGARVLLSGDSRGWSHSVNLVCIAGKTHLVDVGFGGNGPTRPMPLLHGQISQWGATDAEMRLVYRDGKNPVVQGLWKLEHRVSKAHDWTPCYCFGLTEFLPQDFEIMNFATSTRRTSWSTYNIVCLKMILDEEKDDITGAPILSGSTLKRRIFEKPETLVECASEDQRVAVLKEHFGICLSNRERTGIKSSVTELK